MVKVQPTGEQMKNIPKVCKQCDFESTIKNTKDKWGNPRRSCYMFKNIIGCKIPRVSITKKIISIDR